MVGAILINLVLPVLNTSNIRSSFFRPFHKIVFWMFIANFLLLGWLGQMPVEDPYILIGQFCTLFYFSYYLALLPGLGLFERALTSYYISNNFG